MYRVVIVEDDPMVSLLNRTFVERDARFEVVQSFQDGRAALAWLEQNPADLAVLDVYMPLFTGLELLHALRGQGVGLIVTVDCGIACKAEAAAVVEAGLGLAITDHHEPVDLVPEGVPVADPKCDANCPSSILAGVGVAFFLMAALNGKLEAMSGKRMDMRQVLDLVALGTLADMVSLTGQNRILVKNGLLKIAEAKRLSLIHI